MTASTSTKKYIVALVALAVAFALRYNLHTDLGNRIPFAFFTLSTLIASWYGGLGPGLVAAVGGLVLADVYFLPPHSSDGGFGETERTSIGIYAMTNTLIVVLFWHLHTKLREAKDALRKARGGTPDEAAQPARHSATGEVRPL